MIRNTGSSRLVSCSSPSVLGTRLLVIGKLTPSVGAQVAVPPQADEAHASLSSSYSEWPTQDNTEGIKLAFDRLVGEDGLLGLEQLSSLLQDVGLQAPSDVVLGLVEAQASSQWALTFDET